MTFSPIMGKLVGAMAEALPAKSSVVELGNQTFTVGDSVLAEVMRNNFGERGSGALRDILDLKGRDRDGQVEAYYRALGFDRYVAIDVNEKFGSLPMDLNENLATRYGFEEQFDLVTNNGTGEHVFDQAMVFRNMHQLAAPGGLMLHIMPFVHWENHGFYNFHPILYMDVAHANGYGIEKISLANRWGNEVLVNTDREPPGRTQVHHARGKTGSRLGKISGAARLVNWKRHLQVWLRSWMTASQSLTTEEVCEHIKYPGKGMALAAAIRRLQRGRWGNVLVVALLRKKGDQPFRYPLQGKYFQDIEESNIQEHYSREK